MAMRRPTHCGWHYSLDRGLWNKNRESEPISSKPACIHCSVPDYGCYLMGCNVALWALSPLRCFFSGCILTATEEKKLRQIQCMRNYLTHGIDSVGLGKACLVHLWRPSVNILKGLRCSSVGQGACMSSSIQFWVLLTWSTNNKFVLVKYLTLIQILFSESVNANQKN